MELELGLKITHTRDDITSFADLRVSKDHNGPVFFSTETEALFILIAHLKGYRRENINVKINKYGNRIIISGIRPVQQVLLMGWVLRKKDVELRAFRKRFRIPDGVILDGIKARFKDDESGLTVIMPKSVKGIRGVGIEEVKEEEVDQGIPQDISPTVVDEAIEEEVEKASPEAIETIVDQAIEEDHRIPGSEAVEDIDQIVHKENDRPDYEIAQSVDGEVPLKEKYEDEQKEEGSQPKEETVHAPEQEVEEVGLKGTEEVGEMFQERGDSQVILPQESIQPNIDYEEGSERIAEEKLDGGGSLKMEEVVDQELQEKPKIEDQTGQEEATQEREEPRITKVASHPQEKTMELARVEMETENSQSEKELTSSESSSSEEEDKSMQDEDDKLETLEADEERIPDAVNKESTEIIMAVSPITVEESHYVRDQMPEDSEKREPETNVQEPLKLKPAQEEERAPTPVEQPTNDELHQVKEAINEENPDEGMVSDGNESTETTERQKGRVQEEGEKKNSVWKKSKLCPPLVVAGSAILVTIIVFVITWIRAKRR